MCSSQQYIAPSPKTPHQDVLSYITEQAKEAGVDPVLAAYIVTHESSASTTIIGDMNITCRRGPNKGKPVRAKGIWQITDCGHPEIRDDEAFDLASSTALALPLLKDKKVCQAQFSTCLAYYQGL